jgi:hypothetical protein
MRINQRREAAVKMAIGYLFEEGGDASSVCRIYLIIAPFIERRAGEMASGLAA